LFDRRFHFTPPFYGLAAQEYCSQYCPDFRLCGQRVKENFLFLDSFPGFSASGTPSQDPLAE
jgi:hypothetical protein